MKKSIAIVTTLVSALAITSAAVGGEQRHEIDTDMLHSGAAIKATLSEAYVYSGAVREELSGSIMNGGDFGHSQGVEAWIPRVADRQEIESDMIYGS